MTASTDVSSLAALGDPIRRHLYEFVVAQGEPVSRDMAAAGTQIARHVAKFHLDKLEEEGLLETDYARPSGRSGPGAGRPTKFYRRSTREFSVSLPERHYDLAGRLLANAITVSQRDSISIGVGLKKSASDFGRLLADEVKTHLENHPTKVKVDESISQVLSVHGYEPRREDDCLLLGNCPFHTLAQEYTSLICGINHDLISSMLEALPTKLTAELEPEQGRCCVVLSEIS